MWETFRTLCNWCNKMIERGEAQEIDHKFFHKHDCAKNFVDFDRERVARQARRLPKKNGEIK